MTRRRRKTVHLLLWIIAIGLLATAVNYGLYLNAVRRHPAPGTMVGDPGRRTHLDCRGDGGVTVVLESSLGGWSIEWDAVRAELRPDEGIRLCTYDRAGLGWSDDVGRRVPTDEVVARLHETLTRARVPGPYVLVGFSLGGIYVRQFAHTYPDETAGLVLVDPAHDEMLRRLPRSEVAATKRGIAILRFARFLAPLGVGRLLRQPVATGPASVATLKTSLGYRPSAYLAYYNEASEFVRESTGDRAVPTIPPVPVVLIEATDTLERPQGAGKVWQQMYAELAAQSPETEVVVVDSDHFVPIRHPDVVANAIRSVVRQAMRSK